MPELREAHVTRISRDMMFMAIAHVVAKRSTCYRLNVGAVLTVDGNIVSIGYNGAPSGKPHCSGNDCPGVQPGKCPTVHAEINALRRWRLFPGLGSNASLYITDEPCQDCAFFIAGWGIERVIFDRPYRDHAGIEYLMREGIHVSQITPAGYVIDKSTGLVQPPDA